MTTATAERPGSVHAPMDIRKKRHVSNASVARYIFLILVTLLALFPIVYVISASLKTNKELMLGGVNIFTANPTLDNFKQAWGLAHFGRYTLNSIYVCAIAVTGVVITSSMSAYVFSRGKFPGKKIIYTMFLATMFVSAGSVTIFPISQLAAKLHLNNLTGLGVIQMFTISAVNLFLTMGYMKTISTEIDEAAEIDGCSFFRTYWNIIMPLSKPILATVALTTFQSVWNEYLLSRVMTIHDSMTYTLVVGVTQLKSMGGEGAAQWNLMMAGTLFAIVPIIVVYLSLNQYFIAGLTAGSVKG